MLKDLTPKENAPAGQPADESANRNTCAADSTQPSRITAKPPRFSAREMRAIRLLQQHAEVNRRDLDRYLAANNSPDTIQHLRRKLGEDAIHTERFSVVNAHGEKAQAGRYILTPQGRARLAEMGVQPC